MNIKTFKNWYYIPGIVLKYLHILLYLILTKSCKIDVIMKDKDVHRSGRAWDF